MTYTHTISSTCDASYLLDKAGVVNLFSIAVNDRAGTQTIDYIGTSDQYEAIVAAIEAYPTSYAEEVLKPRLSAQVTSKRYEVQQSTTMNGSTIACDDVTIGRLTAVVVLMDADPNAPTTRRWKMPNGSWQTLDRDQLVAMSSAIAAHVQACFDCEEAPLAQIGAAENVDALDALDLETGWPTGTTSE